MTHVNRNDGSVEGLRYAGCPAFSTQYLPDHRGDSTAGPTPSAPFCPPWLRERKVASMPKRNDIRRVLVIGSGPIVIGQAAEFDYAGTRPGKALHEEGLEVILVNSNPPPS